ncbi:MAG: hypothetical protein U1F61_20070 [Opitutaceae bacterium]
MHRACGHLQVDTAQRMGGSETLLHAAHRQERGGEGGICGHGDGLLSGLHRDASIHHDQYGSFLQEIDHGLHLNNPCGRILDREECLDDAVLQSLQQEFGVVEPDKQVLITTPLSRRARSAL